MLADDMTRLCGEILALREAREGIIAGLTRGAMGRRQALSEMKAGFRNAHTEMARRSKADRVSFLLDLNKKVGHLRQETASDLQGARLAWSGKSG